MIKNEKQIFFNQVKGEIIEIEISDEYSSVTLTVGRDNKRKVNLAGKTVFFNEFINKFRISDKVVAQFYISSNKKNDRWYTTATLLSMNMDC